MMIIIRVELISLKIVSQTNSDRMNKKKTYGKTHNMCVYPSYLNMTKQDKSMHVDIDLFDY